MQLLIAVFKHEKQRYIGAVTGKVPFLKVHIFLMLFNKGNVFAISNCNVLVCDSYGH